MRHNCLHTYTDTHSYTSTHKLIQIVSQFISERKKKRSEPVCDQLSYV